MATATGTDNFTFFICDKEVLSEDHAGSDEGILCFRPIEESDTNKTQLCCHLIGMMSFAEGRTGKEATIVKMKQKKFALKSIGQYIIGFGRSPSELDAVILEELKMMIDLYLFLYQSITRFKPGSSEVYNEFDFVWDGIISSILQRNDVMAATLCAVPSLKVDHNTSGIFLKSMFVLEGLQRRPGVMTGIIMYDNSVICSQLDASLTMKVFLLTSLPDQQPMNTDSIVDNASSLPYGVKLMRVYLSQEELSNVISTAKCSPYFTEKSWSSSVNAWEDTLSDNLEEDITSTYEFGDKVMTDDDNVSVSLSVSSDASSINTRQSNELLVAMSPSSYSPKLYPPNLTSIMPQDCTRNEECSPPIAARHSISSPGKKECHHLLRKHIEADIQSPSGTIDAQHHEACFHRRPLYLYFQSHSSVVVALFIDPLQENIGVKHLRPIWESILIRSSELEADIRQQTKEISTENKLQTSSVHIAIDHESGTFKDDLDAISSNFNDQAFMEAAKLSRQQYLSSDTLSDTTLKNPHTSVYVRRSQAKTYCLQLRGNCAPAKHGAPTPNDSYCVMEQRLKSVLRKNGEANVLL